MAKLGAWDVIVFGAYMLFSIGVGVRFAKGQNDLKTYLLAGQEMHWALVAISVLAALFSGITYLGAPGEAYSNNLVYTWTLVAFFISTPITTLLFLPFFYNLNLYTAYEYLERRFDLRIRLISSGLFIARVTLWLSLAIYAPSLVIAEMTGWPLALSVILTGLATTFYTTLGGMKAVVWTDTLQFFVLFGGILVVAGTALWHLPGGLSGAWDIAAAGGRTRMVDFSLDPTVRVTVWAALLGGAAGGLVQMVTDQVSVQRYLTATSLQASQRSLWFKLILTVPLVGVFYVTGTLLYAFYEMNPALRDTITKPDRVLPHFVVHQLPSPIPGLLVAAIFAATMSTVSAGINSLTTATLVDFRHRLVGLAAGERQRVREAKLWTVGFGALTTCVALVIGQLGTLIETSNKIGGLLGGPLLGIFFLGVLSRRANGPGALIGAAFGTAAVVMASRGPVSFLWYALIGATVTFAVGWAASLAFAPPEADQQAFVFRPGLGAAGKLPVSPDAKGERRL